jgi:hypothetical protein
MAFQRILASIELIQIYLSRGFRFRRIPLKCVRSAPAGGWLAKRAAVFLKGFATSVYGPLYPFSQLQKLLRL